MYFVVFLFTDKLFNESFIFLSFTNKDKLVQYFDSYHDNKTLKSEIDNRQMQQQKKT